LLSRSATRPRLTMALSVVTTGYRLGYRSRLSMLVAFSLPGSSTDPGSCTAMTQPPPCLVSTALVARVNLDHPSGAPRRATGHSRSSLHLPREVHPSTARRMCPQYHARGRCAGPETCRRCSNHLNLAPSEKPRLGGVVSSLTEAGRMCRQRYRRHGRIEPTPGHSFRRSRRAS
jgi:hypothetical protein